MNSMDLQAMVEAKLAERKVNAFVRRGPGALEIVIARGPQLTVPYSADEALVAAKVEEAARFVVSKPAPAAPARRPATAQRKAARSWDALYNEGGDGYNPYRNR